MLMMNFLFDVSEPNGVFSLDAPGVPSQVPPLKKSKNWLRLVTSVADPEPVDPFPLNFDPDVHTWINEGEMDRSAVVLPSAPPGQPDDSSVGIRIALRDGSLPLSAAAKMTVTICFGRPDPSKQDWASPFQDNNGNSVTTFVWADRPPKINAAGIPVWFFPLIMPLIQGIPDYSKPWIHANKRPASRHKCHRFEYSVGAILTDGATIRHYSHDPEMDVTT